MIYLNARKSLLMQMDTLGPVRLARTAAENNKLGAGADTPFKLHVLCEVDPKDDELQQIVTPLQITKAVPSIKRAWQHPIRRACWYHCSTQLLRYAQSKAFEQQTEGPTVTQPFMRNRTEAWLDKRFAEWEERYYGPIYLLGTAAAFLNVEKKTFTEHVKTGRVIYLTSCTGIKLFSEIDLNAYSKRNSSNE